MLSTSKLRSLAGFAQAHDALDRAVWVAYGWEEEPGETEDETILRRLLALNPERAAIEASDSY